MERVRYIRPLTDRSMPEHPALCSSRVSSGGAKSAGLDCSGIPVRETRAVVFLRLLCPTLEKWCPSDFLLFPRNANPGFNDLGHCESMRHMPYYRTKKTSSRFSFLWILPFGAQSLLLATLPWVLIDELIISLVLECLGPWPSWSVNFILQEFSTYIELKKSSLSRQWRNPANALSFVDLIIDDFCSLL